MSRIRELVKSFLLSIQEVIGFVLGKLYQKTYYPLQLHVYQVARFLGLYSDRVLYQDESALGKKICVFAAYPKAGRIRKELLIYLEEIQRAGFEVVFVSNTPIQEGLDQLQGLCSCVIVRPNMGRDFGAYRTGLLQFEAQIRHADELLLANDSTILVRSLQPVFQKMRGKSIDFWGLNETEMDFYHFSSYFLVFNKAVIDSPVFWKFWHQYSISSSRVYSIRQGEIQLSQRLLKHQFYGDVYVDKKRLLDYFEVSAQKGDFSESIYNIAFMNYVRTHYRFFRELDIPNEGSTYLFMKQYYMSLLDRYNYDVLLLSMLGVGYPVIKRDVLRRRFIPEALVIKAIYEYAEFSPFDIVLTLRCSKTEMSFFKKILGFVGEV